MKTFLVIFMSLLGSLFMSTPLDIYGLDMSITDEVPVENHQFEENNKKLTGWVILRGLSERRRIHESKKEVSFCKKHKIGRRHRPGSKVFSSTSSIFL
jgi:hypothetical protein